MEQALAIGIEDYLNGPGVTAIEWAEKIESLLPPRTTRIRMKSRRREHAPHRGGMITLAIDTSTPRGAVALLRDDKPLAQESFDRTQPKQNLFDAAAKLLSTNATRPCGTWVCWQWDSARARLPESASASPPRRDSPCPQAADQGRQQFDAIALTALPKMPGDCPQMCVFGRCAAGRNLFCDV